MANNKVRSDLNSVIFTGCITKDPELKVVGNDYNILNFSMASNYAQKKGDDYSQEVNYFDVVLSGGRAKALSNYLKKGTRLAVKGVLRQERWEKDGQKNSRIRIMADEVQFMGGGQAGGNSSSAGADSAPAAQGGFPEDIPF